MSLQLLSQFSVDAQLPTIFELLAVDKLTESMRSVFSYAHTMLAEGHPRIAGLLPYSDELFYCMWAALQWSYLLEDSTFEESFFGVKRALLSRGAVHVREAVASAAGEEPSVEVGGSSASDTLVDTHPEPQSSSPVTAVGSGNQPGANAGNAGGVKSYTFQPLDFRRRLLSVVLCVLLPYVKGRLDAYFRNLQDEVQEERDSASMVPLRPAGSPAAMRHYYNRLFLSVYPWLHFLYEGTHLGFRMMFLFERTPFHSPLNYLIGVVVRRMTREDFTQQTGGSRPAHTLLVAIILYFQVRSWWNSNAGGDRARGDGGQVGSSGVPPPPDNTLAITHQSPEADSRSPVAAGQCPLCNRPVVNPCVLTSSGVIFCYPCIKQHVETNPVCPVTNTPTQVSCLRRLYS